MADEQEFIEQGLQRSQIDEFFAAELGRAGYGGMEVAKTPMGTQIVLKAEKPGMVIGKGGKNIRAITSELESRFELDDPQIDVQEVDEPDLNARIVADRLANALERGWYFRKAGHTTIDRIMDAGALGAEIVLAGKVTGARSRVEKFNRGYIKHNGEPADEIVDEGQATAVMKLGTIGVTVKVIPPGANLPDDFRVHEDADVEALTPEEAVVDDGVEELLAEGEAAEPAAAGDGEEVLEESAEPAEESAEPAEESAEPAEEVIEDVADEAAGDEAAGDENAAGAAAEPAEDDVEEAPEAAGADEAAVAEELDEIEAAVETTELDEETEAEAAALVEEMEAAAEDEEEEPAEAEGGGD